MKSNAAIASPLVRRSELERFFAGIDILMEQPNANVAQVSPNETMNQHELKQFFTTVSRRVEQAEMQQRRLDKRQATRFNVFDLIEPDENKLSDILANLLDPSGNHGQGDLFLLLLFKQLGFDFLAIGTQRVTVQREAPTHGIKKYRRRMDVLVEAGTLLAIENKVDSLEQRDQVKDYLEHLRRCIHGSHKQAVLIYLTPNGRLPESLERTALDEARTTGRLHCWSYPVELQVWLKECYRQCEAPKIKHFLSDFVAYIDSHLKRETIAEQREDANED